MKGHQNVSTFSFVSVPNTKITRFGHINALAITSFGLSKALTISAKFIREKSRFRQTRHLKFFPKTNPLKPRCWFALHGRHSMTPQTLISVANAHVLARIFNVGVLTGLGTLAKLTNEEPAAFRKARRMARFVGRRSRLVRQFDAKRIVTIARRSNANAKSFQTIGAYKHRNKAHF